MRAALVVWVAVLLTFTSGPAPLKVPSRPSGQGAEGSEASGPPALEPWATKTPVDVGLKPAPLAALGEQLRATPDWNVHAAALVKASFTLVGN